MSEVLLEAKEISCSPTPGQLLFQDANLQVHEGDVVVLQGKSGCGKTTFLKCLAHLNVYEGHIELRGKTPKTYGIPTYRTRVLYVPQRPSLLPGTPRDFLNVITTFGARKPKSRKEDGVSLEQPIQVGLKWGVQEELWDRKWSDLSGGESQRIALASAVGMNEAEVLLLDEPTSALDASSASMVEEYLVSELKSASSAMKAMVWITHSAEQGSRVGSRFISISAGGCSEERAGIQV